jgi:membrane protease YdiL (CAAX protease family)
VLVYLLLAFGLSWAAQIGLAVWARTDPSLVTPQAPAGLVVALGLMWPPAIGAFVARRWGEGGDFSDAGLRRGPWRYLVYGWGLPPLLTIAAMVLSLPLYPFDPSFRTVQDLMAQAGAAPPMPLAALIAVQIASGLTVGVLINVVFAFGEEFGWRGYLLPRLMSLLGVRTGLVSHGAIWGLWHAPIIALIGYNYPGHPTLGVLLFIVFCLLLGVIFGWLRLASGSVWPPTVAHASLNAIGGLPLLLLMGVDPSVGGTLWSPVGALVLLLAIAAFQRSGALPKAIVRAQVGDGRGDHLPN